MQHKKFYHYSMVSLLSATALLGCTSMPALAEHHAGSTPPAVAKPVTSQQGLVEDQTVARTQEVSRVITYINPVTSKEQQVVKFDQKGNRLETNDDIWPEFAPPYFEGYRANYSLVEAKRVPAQIADDSRSIRYYSADSESFLHPCVTIVQFWDVHGNIVAPDLLIKIPAEQTDAVLEIPTPPEGWEYVNSLPKAIHISKMASGVSLLVQKSSPTVSRQESKTITRQIIVHLPSGDKTVTQEVTATRTVTTAHGKTRTGEWEIPAFVEYQAPVVEGYVADQLTISAQQLDASQLDSQLTPIEIHYQQQESAKDDGQKDQSGTKEDDGKPTGTDSGDKQTDPEAKDKGVGDDTIDSDRKESTESKSEGSQTDPTPTTKDEGVGDDIIDSGDKQSPEMKDEGSQTDSTPATKDEGVGDDTIDSGDKQSPETKDEGSQTDSTPTTKDEGVGDDIIDSDDKQSPATKDEDSQTDPTPATKDEGVGDDTIDTDEKRSAESKSEGSQTNPTPTTKDEGSQTNPTPTTKDEGSQTDPIPTTKDEGVGDDTVDSDEKGSTESKSEGSQTDSTPATKDEGVGDDTIDSDEKESTESKSEGSQTDPTPTTKDEGAGDDTIDTDEKESTVSKDKNSQADPNSTKDEATRADQVSGANQESQVQMAPTIDQYLPQGQTSGQPSLPNQSTDEVNPLAFHDRLSQLQEPLNDLKKTTPDWNKQEQSQLPQTGNRHRDATIPALLMAAWGLVLAWWPLRRKEH
ncbi:mucin-binding protein [Limosilactobacillus kribbianus]|uniref:mucin-binding protein n=1 Tax=Limosilactobacillus kribbianus TaxID=2982695 RepID=UPI0022654E7A|nr:hypothetical protein [Limosilactobacillus kribbianus]